MGLSVCKIRLRFLKPFLLETTSIWYTDSYVEYIVKNTLNIYISYLTLIRVWNITELLQPHTGRPHVAQDSSIKSCSDMVWYNIHRRGVPTSRFNRESLCDLFPTLRTEGRIEKVLSIAPNNLFYLFVNVFLTSWCNIHKTASLWIRLVSRASLHRSHDSTVEVVALRLKQGPYICDL